MEKKMNVNQYDCENCHNYEMYNHASYNYDDCQNCCKRGVHKYASHLCNNCDFEYCACCGNTNVDSGYQVDFMNCPQCGHDYYQRD